jgi:hypothetical protein
MSMRRSRLNECFLKIKGKLQYHHRRLTTSQYHHRKWGNSYITIQKVAKLISPVAQTYITTQKTVNSYITFQKSGHTYSTIQKVAKPISPVAQTYITIDSDVSNHNNNNHPTTTTTTTITSLVVATHFPSLHHLQDNVVSWTNRLTTRPFCRRPSPRSSSFSFHGRR